MSDAICKSNLQQCSAKFSSSFHFTDYNVKIIRTKKRIIINNLKVKHKYLKLILVNYKHIFILKMCFKNKVFYFCQLIKI